MNEISLIDGLYITLSSMLVVFLTLFVISLILSSFKNIFKENKIIENKLSRHKEEVAITNEEDEEDKIVVALAASIMAGNGKVNPNLHIRSITRIK
ncbi:MAG: OadG family protein [Peptostreptococcaceae bacterium]